MQIDNAQLRGKRLTNQDNMKEFGWVWIRSNKMKIEE
jgi:hypothetical protein